MNKDVFLSQEKQATETGYKKLNTYKTLVKTGWDAPKIDQVLDEIAGCILDEKAPLSFSALLLLVVIGPPNDFMDLLEAYLYDKDSDAYDYLRGLSRVEIQIELIKTLEISICYAEMMHQIYLAEQPD